MCRHPSSRLFQTSKGRPSKLQTLIYRSLFVEFIRKKVLKNNLLDSKVDSVTHLLECPGHMTMCDFYFGHYVGFDSWHLFKDLVFCPNSFQGDIPIFTPGALVLFSFLNNNNDDVAFFAFAFFEVSGTCWS